MYKHILIPLENSPADATILTHIKPLAGMTGAKLLLVHVADGWVARNFNQLKLAESQEMREDREYLEKRQRELTAEGFTCDAVLALGEPSDDIIKLAREKGVDEKILDEAIDTAVQLSHRYIPARQLPDKGVSLLDTACARVAVSQHARPAEVEDLVRRRQALEESQRRREPQTNACAKRFIPMRRIR